MDSNLPISVIQNIFTVSFGDDSCYSILLRCCTPVQLKTTSNLITSVNNRSYLTENKNSAKLLKLKAMSATLQFEYAECLRFAHSRAITFNIWIQLDSIYKGFYVLCDMILISGKSAYSLPEARLVFSMPASPHAIHLEWNQGTPPHLLVDPEGIATN